MIVVDIEGTGVEPEKHSILSIGALDFYHPKDRFYTECQAFPGADVMDDALKIAGFTREEIRDPKKPTLKAAMQQFLAWAAATGEHMLAGHNPSFDRDFLKASAARYHLDWDFAHRTIDLHSVCYAHILQHGMEPPSEHGRSALNLDRVAEYVGIPRRPEGMAHNSMTDALITAEALWRLCYDEPHLAEFAQYPVPWAQ